jgi:hypothetical protein
MRKSTVNYEQFKADIKRVKKMEENGVVFTDEGRSGRPYVPSDDFVQSVDQ